MIRIPRHIVFFSVVFLCCCAASANLVPNGDLENVSADFPPSWAKLWTRDAGRGEAALDKEIRHSGKHSVRIEHRGPQDWSLASEKRLDVRSGDLFTIQGWVRTKGTGSATIGVIAYDADGKAVDWVLGGRTASGVAQWHLLRSRFVIPDNVATILPRLIGYGPATVWLDDFSLVKDGNIAQMRPANMPRQLTVAGTAISLTVDTLDASCTVTDKRTGHIWRQKPSKDMTVFAAAKSDNGIKMTLLDGPSGMDIEAVFQLHPILPEFTVTLSASGTLETALQFPDPFVTEDGTYLVVPMNEGVSYPVEDKTINPMRLIAYGGHGICMAFWGVTDGKQGHMSIIETPDDAAIRIKRIDAKLCIAPEWDSQKARFGYNRKLRYAFFDKGGHVAICKRYRQHAKKTGKFKTLAQKREENPNVDLLIGAVNVWCWERDALEIVREMRAAGIGRILWSNRKQPETIKAMNEIDGVLTSRYDIYQDLMDSKIAAEKLRGLHADWTQAGW
ncbi:MAG: hypothetical protein ACYS8Z_10485, partial [Planctomycetota bacterium]